MWPVICFPLWLSGLGDLIAKLTAVEDWKLTFHPSGEVVNDFVVLLPDAAVCQIKSRLSHFIPIGPILPSRKTS